MHPQLRISDRVGSYSHGAGATGMMRGDRGIPDPGVDLSVALDLVTRCGLGAAIRRHRLLIGDIAGAFDALAQTREVVRGGEKLIDNARRLWGSLERSRISPRLS